MVTATYVGKAKVDFDVILKVSMSGNDEEAWHSRRQVTDLQSYQPEIRAVVEIVVVGEEGI